MGRPARKLLVAAVGVAAVTYACNKKDEIREPVGNLVAPAYDAGPTTPPDQPVVGNLVAPPPLEDASIAATDASPKKNPR